ncbi:hypothetical protein PanWU01x14_189520 [Parasponia andersonii]|uniref:Uncharacterized protein n=1 Tax=Parasponia andersonii TaxID=3476 RepID=A0A2P5C2H0_PARAD|nr:hypothetical protein PanWU01x14_189520 [Parasponia andersonii]
MFFNPKMVFLLNPIPRSRRESARTEGNEIPVLESTIGSEDPARESDPKRGAVRLAKKKFSASSRKGCFGFVEPLEKTATPATAAPAAAAAAEATVRAAAALYGREVAEGV